MVSRALTFLLVLFIAAVIPRGSSGANLPDKTQRQGINFPLICTGFCFRIRSRARTQCARTRRMGGMCTVDRCVRPDGRRGSQCTFIPPLPPVVIVAPTATVSVTPSPSSTPSVSPSLTPSPSVSPTTSVTPAVTPTSSVTPSPSQSCEFTLAGTIGVTATSGRCTCGTSVATVIVLAPVSNEGGPLPNPDEASDPARGIQMEAVDCYNGCVNDLFALSCDPGSFGTFSADGQAIVNSCCERCRNTRDRENNVPGPGEGVSAATNQCRLSTAEDL